MSGPLRGLKVVEFSGLGPAPLAGQLLADLGADVICIDRHAAQAADPTDINRRNKRSIVIDLKRAEGVAIARSIVAGADILIEGFRPGVMERLGLGPQDMHERLIYGRMTGWGQSGPLAKTAGHDINYLALTGALHAIGPAGGAPIPPLNMVADYGGGAMFLIFGILAALYERTRSGLGQVVDAAMVDGVPAMMGLIHCFLARGAWREERGANLLDGGAPFYRCYECSDGEYIAIGSIEPPFFRQLLVLMGLDEALCEKQHDPDHWPALRDALDAAFKQRTRDQWMAVLEGSDSCASPVLRLAEATAHPHNVDRNAFITVDGVMQAAPAPRFSRTSPSHPQRPGGGGGHTSAILTKMGWNADRIAAATMDNLII